MGFFMARSNYETVDFQDLTESGGLKPLISALTAASLKVVSVESNNKQKRQHGYPTKVALINFEDGQHLRLFVNSSGAIYRTNMNGSPLPVRSTDLKGFISEVSQKLLSNSKSFQANLRKRVKLIEKGKQNAIRTTSKQKLAAAEEAKEELADQLKEAEETLANAIAEKESIEDSIAESNTISSDLTNEINTIMAEIAQLEGDSE